MDYNQMFDLKAIELSLKILICSKDPNIQTEDAHVQTEHSSSVEVNLLNLTKLPNVKFTDVNQLPHLPFLDQAFELILCPDILFSEAFNLEGVLELLRVGSEVRFSPLADLKGEGESSKYLAYVLKSLQEKSMGVEIRQIQPLPDSSALPNAMLRIWIPGCYIR